MARGVLRTECRVCEREVAECGPLSARGKCADCGDDRLRQNNAELRAHRGPFFRHWRARTLAAFGVVEVDAGRDEA